MFDFGHITDLGTLRREYKRLALKHHPDMPGGSEAAMKALNNAYDAAVERITAAAARRRDTTTATDSSTADTAQAAREYREVLSRLIHLRGLEIELCGRWLWIGGNTYPHREALKAAGCRWSKSKGKWYWHASDEVCTSRRSMSMDYIRDHYGSRIISGAHAGEVATV